MIDWQNWIGRWDEQQTNYIPGREERFDAMLEACEALLPPDFVALDLACGPGAISNRLLRRFPQARVVALDYNPILMRLGQETIDPNRVRWVKANLMSAGWSDGVREQLQAYDRSDVDAVLTTTAMHWLPGGPLADAYGEMASLVREGGIYLDGDHLAYASTQPMFRRVVATIREREQAAAFAQPNSENYKQWWDGLLDELRAHAPDFDDLLAEHERNEQARTRGWSEPTLQFHQAALSDAGFTQIDTIWQQWDDRVLLAIKGGRIEPIRN